MAAPKINPSDPWYIIVLKVIAYAISLILAALAGVGTADAANLLGLL